MGAEMTNAAAKNDHPLGDQTLLRIDGSVLRVATLWEESPALLVFLRHFG